MGVSGGTWKGGVGGGTWKAGVGGGTWKAGGGDGTWKAGVFSGVLPVTCVARLRVPLKGTLKSWGIDSKS